MLEVSQIFWVNHILRTSKNNGTSFRSYWSWRVNKWRLLHAIYVLNDTVFMQPRSKYYCQHDCDHYSADVLSAIRFQPRGQHVLYRWQVDELFWTFLYMRLFWHANYLHRPNKSFNGKTDGREPQPTWLDAWGTNSNIWKRQSASIRELTGYPSSEAITFCRKW